MTKKTPNHGEFCWNELMTPDLKKAKEFYKSLLHWESEDQNIGDNTYTMFKAAGNDFIGGMMQIPAGQEKKIPPHWMGYISVDDVDAIIKKAQQLGAKVTVPATNVSDYGRFSVIEDPTGAHVAFWQSLKSCD